ncbi:hypothetical protein [Nocardioides renjunii]|uniref:hypothetical protein n=1 Tax=Nocardioides renjunii TaxID=3095075 RepID=UPI002AFFE60C|nr:hypothetical protein [Nocardioides sp. S-34]WQQ23386.1 hypothetical protein SHK17_05240 [Nocardioides sp. S-34]
MTTRARAALLAPALTVTLAFTLAACSDEPAPVRETGVDPEWYAELDRAVEDADQVGDVPVLSSGSCPIDTPEVAGHDLDEDSPDVGVSTLGDSGHRLICSWSPPATDLVVARFDDPAELELAREDVSRVGEVDNGQNVQVTEAITVGRREFFVRRTTFPTNDSHIDYAVWFLDEDEQGLVLLDVETTDTHDLIETYDAQQAAQDLADLLS